MQGELSFVITLEGLIKKHIKQWIISCIYEKKVKRKNIKGLFSTIRFSACDGCERVNYQRNRTNDSFTSIRRSEKKTFYLLKNIVHSNNH